MLFIYLFCGVGMSDELEKCVWDVCFTFDVISQNYAPTQVCRKTASQHGYVVKLSQHWNVVKLCPDPSYVVKLCLALAML